MMYVADMKAVAEELQKNLSRLSLCQGNGKWNSL